MNSLEKLELEGKGLSNEDIQKIEWINDNYELYPGLLIVSIPSIAYKEHALESGFNIKREGENGELTEQQKKVMANQRSTFEKEYLQSGDELLVLGCGEIEENNVTGIFNFSKAGDVVTLHGHARLQGIDLDMSYVAEDDSLVESIHVTILRSSEILMKKKF